MLPGHSGGVCRLTLRVNCTASRTCWNDVLPGDAVAVMPENKDAVVDYVLSRLRMPRDAGDVAMRIQRNIDIEGAFDVQKEEDMMEVEVEEEMRREGGGGKVDTARGAVHARRPHKFKRIARDDRKNDDQVSVLLRLAASDRTTLRSLLRRLDVTSLPSRKTLVRLSHFCRKRMERDALRGIGASAELYERFRQTRASLVDVLRLFSSCRPTPDHLLACLHPISPRMYSISSIPPSGSSSSSRHTAGSCSQALFQICFRVVKYGGVDEAGLQSLLDGETLESRDSRDSRDSERCSDDKSTSKYGLCSSWLASRNVGAAVDIGRSARGKFHPPLSLRSPNKHINPNSLHLTNEIAETARPVVMVGSGTGVSPFVGFMARRKRTFRYAENPATWWMIAGFRNVKDVTFSNELSSFQNSRRIGGNAKETLNRLHLVYSRPSAAKEDSPTPVEGRYVQDCLRQHAVELEDLLMKKGGIMFVCGRQGMASGVKDVVRDVVGGESVLQRLIDDGKYVEESWC